MASGQFIISLKSLDQSLAKEVVGSGYILIGNDI